MSRQKQQQQQKGVPLMIKGSNTKETRQPKKKSKGSAETVKKDLTEVTVETIDGNAGIKKKSQRKKKESRRKVKEKDLKQFFKMIQAATIDARKVKKHQTKDPTKDYLPEKLKVFTRSEEERTCARTKKAVKVKEAAKIATPSRSKSDDALLPKNNENNGKLFDKNGEPFWTAVMFDQEEAEKDGIEVEGRLTADHVVKYLEGALTIIPPADFKAEVLDNTRDLEDIKAMDDEYFNEDAIIYHTLRNVIHHSERALQRCMTHGNEDGRQRSASSEPISKKSSEADEEPSRPTKIRFFLSKNENVVYDRKNIAESIAPFLKRRRNLAMWDEEVSAVQSDCYYLTD